MSPLRSDPVPHAVDHIVDAWNRGDMYQVLAAYHEDAVLVFIGGFDNLLGQEFHGREAIRECFEESRATFDSEVEVERAVQVGERLLLIQRHTARGRAGGVETTMRYGTVLSLRDGLVGRNENYYDVTEALAAVGLSE